MDIDNNAGRVAIEPTQLLVDLFKASAELRFHIKSLRIARIEYNPSWDRHTEAMRKAESFITTNPSVSISGDEPGCAPGDCSVFWLTGYQRLWAKLVDANRPMRLWRKLRRAENRYQKANGSVDAVVGELSEIIRSLEDVVRHCKEMDYIAVALMLRGDTDRLRHVKENLIPNAPGQPRLAKTTKDNDHV